MPPSLAQRFLKTGILQFGRFQVGSEFVPIRLAMEYLPAYPDLLQNLAFEAQARLTPFAIDRLVATADAVPFGVALSLLMNRSLVYSRGKGESVVFDLVGAYNAGHQAVLITNVFEDFHALNPLIAHANRVGLQIQGISALVDFGIANSSGEIERVSVVRLPDMVNELSQSGLLPVGQAQAVLNWIEQRMPNHHPGAAVP